MALPKKKSRKIIVDELAYRWLTSGNDYGIDIYVELYDKPGQLLWGRADYRYDANRQQLGVTPSDVESLIREALVKGWAPGTTGKDFKLF